MTESNMNAINDNRSKIKEVFNVIKEPLYYASEKNLDKHMALAIKMKRIGVEVGYDDVRYYKLDRNNKTCNMPVLTENEKQLILEMPDLFLYLNLHILKNSPVAINKKNLRGFYFKYKNWHFVAFANGDEYPSYYQITTVKPLHGRKPIEITPYNQLRRAHH